MSRVRSVIEAAIAGRSWPYCRVFGTRTLAAPVIAAMIGYASKDRLAQRHHPHVGVAVDLGGRLRDRLDHPGQWPVRHLVARQLDRVGEPELAGDVGGVAA